MIEARRMQSRSVRLVNRLGGRLSSRISLNPEYLMDRASAATGLHDFGDSGFEPALRVLTDSFEREARFHLVGRMLAQRELLRCLTNRLLIEEYFRRNPETADIPVPDPVVITGAPRAGTTFLHRLLAQDPATRTLRAWELFAPVPSALRPSDENDSRRHDVALGIRWRRQLLMSRAGRSTLQAIHHFEAGDPEECWPLLQNAFLSGIFALHSPADSYRFWIRTQDFTPAYRYYRKQIQILTAALPATRLVVKHPGHLGHLEELFRIFANARVLWVHRDQLEVIASAGSLCAAARVLRTNSVDLKQIGKAIVENALWRLRTAVCARERHGSERYLDVQYLDITRNTMETVRRIYDFLGFPFTAELERIFKQYIDQNRRERKGHRHEYSLEMFGLDPNTLRPLFQEYADRFHIPPGKL